MDTPLMLMTTQTQKRASASTRHMLEVSDNLMPDGRPWMDTGEREISE